MNYTNRPGNPTIKDFQNLKKIINNNLEKDYVQK